MSTGKICQQQRDKAVATTEQLGSRIHITRQPKPVNKVLGNLNMRTTRQPPQLNNWATTYTAVGNSNKGETTI